MTRLRLRSLAAASLVAILGCKDSVAPAPAELAGAWADAPDAHLPQGWYQRHLVFRDGGRFAWELRSYGAYPGQPEDQLSSFSRIEGTFRKDGNRLLFDPERSLWWDRFYGSNSPVRVEQPYRGGIFDDATYEVSGDRLTINYIGEAPNDGRVAATAVYTRVDER